MRNSQNQSFFFVPAHFCVHTPRNLAQNHINWALGIMRNSQNQSFFFVPAHFCVHTPRNLAQNHINWALGIMSNSQNLCGDTFQGTPRPLITMFGRTKEGAARRYNIVIRGRGRWLKKICHTGFAGCSLVLETSSKYPPTWKTFYQ